MPRRPGHRHHGGDDGVDPQGAVSLHQAATPVILSQDSVIQVLTNQWVPRVAELAVAAPIQEFGQWDFPR